MENKKGIIIVIVILILYFLLMVVIVGIDQVRNKIYHFEMVLSPDTYLKYENGHFSDAKKTTDLTGKSYKVYGDHQFLYDALLQNAIGQWYAFDNNDEPLSLPEDFFAYRGNRKIEVKEFEILDMTEEEIGEAKQLLKNNNISFEPIFIQTKKVEFDLDSDGRKETVYMISNDTDFETQTKKFSIAYMKKDSKTEILISHISEDYTKVPFITLSEIIDYNKNKKYELIFKKTYFDQIGSCHEIFEYKKKKFRSIKECKIAKGGDEEA